MAAPATIMKKAMPIPTKRPTMTLLFSGPDEFAVTGAESAVAVELGGIDTVVVEVRAATIGSSDGAGVVLEGFDFVVAIVALMVAEACDGSRSFTRQPTKS
jgi:hypothetical protein